jgi:hypothetical protein
LAAIEVMTRSWTWKAFEGLDVVGVVGVEGLGQELLAGEAGPDRADGGLGEAVVGDDLLGEPLLGDLLVALGQLELAEAGEAHVRVPGHLLGGLERGVVVAAW